MAININDLFERTLQMQPLEKEWLIHEEDDGTRTATPVRPSGDLKRKASEASRPIIETDAYLAVSQYDVVSDKTTYRLQRK